MAAGAQILTSANKRSTFRRLKQATNYRNNISFDPVGLYAFDTGAQTVAATNTETANDLLFTFQFPNDCYLYDLQVTVTDLDSGANLVFDVITSDTGASGGTEVVLINDTSIGQTGGSDELDRNNGLMLSDVSGLYLGIKVGTGAAAGAQAGTIRFKGLLHMGAPLTGF